MRGYIKPSAIQFYRNLQWAVDDQEYNVHLTDMIMLVILPRVNTNLKNVITANKHIRE